MGLGFARGCARVALGACLILGSAVAAQPAEPVAPVEVPFAAELAPPPPPAPAPRLAIDRLDRAWSARSMALVERAARTRSAADEIGVGDLDPLARAALWNGEDSATPLERAQAAVLLAPALPIARAELASAQWGAGAYLDSVASAGRAVRALAAHLDGWLWLSLTGSVLGLAALVLGTVAFLGARGVALARFVAHDLGDALEPTMPMVARYALVTALVVAPAALGEGLAGLALGLCVLCSIAPSREQRIAVALAAAAFVTAVHPLAQVAGRRIAAVGSDAVGAASWAVESGFLDPTDALRLARAAGRGESGAPEDPLALAALAEWTRRAGDLATADAQYTKLVAGDGADADVLTNAASVKLAIGDAPAAIALYRRAIAIEPSAALWFLLSQAHGAAIDVEQHDRALAAAQSIDPVAVSELTERLAASSTPSAIAVPLPQQRIRERLLSQDASAAAAGLRSRLAPGWLGSSPWLALVAFAAACGLGAVFASRFEPSLGCRDCGAHLCHRCGTAPRGDGRCEACQSRRFEGRSAWERASASLPERVLGWLAFWIPGVLGASGRRSLLGFGAMLAAAGAIAAWIGHDAVAPDPGSVGGAGRLALAFVAALCVALHAGIASLAAVLARRQRS